MNAYKTVFSTKTRISKKALAELPPEVADAVRDIQSGHPNIKSFTFTGVEHDYPFYAGEGYEITVIVNDRRSSVEMAAEHNAGSAGVSYRIGESFTAPVGAFVLVVTYYDKYYLTVYNVQQPAMPVEPESPALPAVVIPTITPEVVTPEMWQAHVEQARRLSDAPDDAAADVPQRDPLPPHPDEQYQYAFPELRAVGVSDRTINPRQPRLF